MQGKLTLLFSTDGLQISLKDELSGMEFLQIDLDPAQTMRVLSRQAYVDCDFVTVGLNKVGKKVTRDYITFEMPSVSYDERDKVAEKLALQHCPPGWSPQLYFQSRDSFHRKEGKQYCRVMISKWEEAQ